MKKTFRIKDKTSTLFMSGQRNQLMFYKYYVIKSNIDYFSSKVDVW